MSRKKSQGLYRIRKAVLELEILQDSLEEVIKDNFDKYSIALEIEQIKWLLDEGTKDLLEGE